MVMIQQDHIGIGIGMIHSDHIDIDMVVLVEPYTLISYWMVYNFSIAWSGENKKFNTILQNSIQFATVHYTFLVKLLSVNWNRSIQ